MAIGIGPWELNYVDIIVLIVVSISALMAFSRGLKRELISIFALLVGAVATLIVWGKFRTSVQKMIDPPQLADLVLGAGTFFLVYLLVGLFLAGILGADRKAVSGTDRLLGGLFGAMRGLVICALVVMLDTANYREGNDLWELGEYFEQNPGEIPQELIEKWEAYSKVLGEAPPELDEKYQNSTLYPILDRIGAGIRTIPFSQLKSIATRLKNGEDVDPKEILRIFGND